MDELLRLLDSVSPSMMLELVLSQSINSKPALTLREELTTHTVRELRELARDADVEGTISKMNKRTLVSKLVDIFDAPTDQLLLVAQTHGSGYLRDLRRLCQAGGHIEIPFEEFKSLDQVPIPHPPLTLLYDWEDTLHVVVPREICDRFQSVDWDLALQQAEPFERAMDYLDALVDLRGIVPLHEGVNECVAYLPDGPSADDIMDSLYAGASGARTRFGLVPIYDVRCLVHGNLLATLDEDDENDLEDAWADIEGIFVDQEGLVPRPMTDEVLHGGVCAMLREQKPYKDLAAHLEARAPEGVGPAMFSSGVLAMLVSFSRYDEDPYNLSLIFSQMDYRIAEKDADELIGLYAQLMAHIPRWDRNGWSWHEEICGKAGHQETFDDDEAVLSLV